MCETPRYKHDCTGCVFLGIHGEYDLYFCPTEPTLLARRSDKGSDYRSGLAFGVVAYQKGDTDYPLFHAYVRAIERGFLSESHPIVASALWHCFGREKHSRIWWHTINTCKDPDAADFMWRHFCQVTKEISEDYKQWYADRKHPGEELSRKDQ